ncbi:unnamed protein product, partial [Mycena citricolor]
SSLGFRSFLRGTSTRVRTPPPRSISKAYNIGTFEPSILSSVGCGSMLTKLPYATGSSTAIRCPGAVPSDGMSNRSLTRPEYQAASSKCRFSSMELGRTTPR